MNRLFPPPDMPIENFTFQYPPSSLLDFSWIQVFSSSYKAAHVNLQKINISGKKLRNLNLEQVQAKREEIDALAKETNCISGKWMLKIQPKDIDEAWRIIAKTVKNDEFGKDICAKVSTPNTNIAMGEPDVHTICVYTSNYFNEKEVFEVRKKITELKIDQVCEPKIYYKPDIFTYLGALGEKDKYRHATYIYIDD